ncbi:50S ribosomal protein L10 [Candidatus Pacearchaeota archaeon]|nr:50S ribosomal protein L10 [Candidatus Pacearchaeota archaeon]
MAKANKETNGNAERAAKAVPEAKLKAVSKITGLIKANKTIMIASVKNMPSSQFQDIRKKLRNDATIIIAKKSTIEKALESGNSQVKDLKKHIDSDYAFIFSKLSPFELAALLSENRSPVKARIGQEAAEDIIVDAGPTDLIPGPAISELGALGLKIAIEDGKINIREGKAIVRKGEKVSEAAASIMAKLSIKPFTVGFEPIAAYDAGLNKVYVGIRVNKKQTLEELKLDYAKSLGFAQKMEYMCKETIGFLLAKAQSHERALHHHKI